MCLTLAKLSFWLFFYQSLMFSWTGSYINILTQPWREKSSNLARTSWSTRSLSMNYGSMKFPLTVKMAPGIHTARGNFVSICAMDRWPRMMSWNLSEQFPNHCTLNITSAKSTLNLICTYLFKKIPAARKKTNLIFILFQSPLKHTHTNLSIY